MDTTLEQANAELLQRRAKLEATRERGVPQKLKASSPSILASDLPPEEAAKRNAETQERIAAAEASQAARDADDAREAFRRRLARARIPARHAQRELTGGPEWDSALENIRGRIGSGFLLALLGIRGSGKTQLAVEAIRGRVEAGYPGRYAKAMDMIIRFREAFRKDGPTEKAVLEEFLQPNILVIDAMEERGETQFEDRMIAHLIDLRYDAMLDTLLISNQTREAFAKSIGNSAVSRLIETGEVIECTWESFRKKVDA